MRPLGRVLETLGPAGVVGLGVLLFCLAFHWTALVPAQAELARATIAAERQRARPALQRVAADGAAAQLARFHASFPPAAQLADRIEEIYAHARAANLRLQQAEYRLESQDADLAAYRVVLPVRGRYAQLRQFFGRTLASMPTTSLDALRFDRKKASDAQLEAQVQLTVYMRTDTRDRGI